MLGLEHVALDPSRIAAQIVSGIGFIGGGLIFVRRDAVRGLTTAATIWLVAAVGSLWGGAPGAGGCRDPRALRHHPRLPAVVARDRRPLA
ncbi:MAG TPA: MgtC/SapB family protein [Pseudonocardia sp.]|nr:MgtC/SapB family protein [Pseudonocardia sp.]